MRFYAPLALASLFSLTGALRLSGEPESSGQVVHLPIQRRHVKDPLEHDRQRRQATADTVNVQLANLDTLYLADVSLGTPPQKLRVHIDTGSADLWSNSPDSKICQERGGVFCKRSGIYNANASSTYQYLNSDFEISYVDRSGAAGDYATDTFSIGGITVDDLQFGIGYQSSTPEGILGIGYPTLEAQVVRLNQQPYDNLPAKLVANGNIQTNAYSLWLNDLDASTGSILFGGVDTQRYHGELASMPILAMDGVHREFFIEMAGLGYNGKPTALDTKSFPVLLDSGSSLSYLPVQLAAEIIRMVGGMYEEKLQAAVVKCSLADQQDTIDFAFNGVTITVPLNELVLHGHGSSSEEYCVFGIAPAIQSNPVLGDTFLRSAYVVYDIDSNEISLAQTNFNVTSTQVEAIQPGSGGVPNARGTPEQVADKGMATHTKNAAPMTKPTGSAGLGLGIGLVAAAAAIGL